MISIRTFARSAPRVAARLSKTPILRSTAAAARPAPLLQSAFLPSRTQCASAFSTSSVRARSASPESDAELVEKIANEIEMEEEMKAENEVPTSVKDYLDNCPFEIVDTPGQEEVVLTRTFGDEKIHISFSIADINSLDPESDYQDPAMADEGDLDANPEQNNPSEAEDVAPGEEADQSFPARVNIIIEKPNRGALAVETVADEGNIVIDNVYYYSDASFAYAKTPEKAHQRQQLYVGPPFGNLDEDLQVLLERYLDERGINQALAIFVPDYIDMKEQKEYIRWLQNVKSFIEA
ncbi:regulatory SUAPRGA1 protein [Rutstroemia sp. NJR-2017a WRK4]|nr:regulatory SUAPRGA1 protein [Rutstroemia sp. NJR-2017a WRK4]